MIWVGDRYGYLPIASEDRPKSDALPTPPAISLARLTCVEEHSVFGPAIAVAVCSPLSPVKRNMYPYQQLNSLCEVPNLAQKRRPSSGDLLAYCRIAESHPLAFRMVGLLGTVWSAAAGATFGPIGNFHLRAIGPTRFAISVVGADVITIGTGSRSRCFSERRLRDVSDQGLDCGPVLAFPHLFRTSDLVFRRIGDRVPRHGCAPSAPMRHLSGIE